MGYLITFRSFSVALIMILCCQGTKSARPWNPEADDDCVPFESLETQNNMWNREDRVFVCQITQFEFDVYSYARHEPIAYFSSIKVLFEEMSGLSIRFTVAEESYTSHSSFRCTFSQIGHAREFVRKVHPTMRFSPREFVLRKLEKCNVRRGHSENRELVTTNPLIFHQHFLRPNSMKFTFEPANEESAEEPLTFVANKFRLRATNSKVLLVNRESPALYYILDFGNSRSNSEFMSYAVEFSIRDFDVVIPDELDE